MKSVTWGLAQAVAGLLALGAGGAEAADAAAVTGSTVIVAERMTYDYRRSVAVFEGSVVVDDPQMHMESDKLTVLFDKDNSIKSATATGNVRIRQGERKATCQKAVFLGAAKEVVLTGKPVLTQGADLISGDVITFWVDEDRVVSEPAYIRIQPRGGAGLPGPRK